MFSVEGWPPPPKSVRGIDVCHFWAGAFMEWTYLHQLPFPLHCYKQGLTSGMVDHRGNDPGCLNHHLEESCPGTRIGLCLGLGPEKWISIVFRPFCLCGLFIPAFTYPDLVPVLPGLHLHAPLSLLHLS